MSSILFDKPSDLFYQPLPGALSHFWLTPTKAGDEPELIALNNCSDIGPRSFFAPYPYTAEHAKEAIYSRGLAISEPLATEQVKKDGKLVRKDLPLLLLDVLRDSRTMKVIGGAGCFQPSMPHADPVIASYESSASKPAEVNFIGYKLHPDYRGKGIITQVVKTMIEFWEENRGYKTFWAMAETDNPSSHAVLLRCGFSLFAGSIPLAWPEDKGGGTKNVNYFIRE